MNCREYAPWVSRYLDEDLEGKDLTAFLLDAGETNVDLFDMKQVPSIGPCSTSWQGES